MDPQLLAEIWVEVKSNNVHMDKWTHRVLYPFLSTMNFNPKKDEGIEHIQMILIEKYIIDLSKIRQSLWLEIAKHRKLDHNLFLELLNLINVGPENEEHKKSAIQELREWWDYKKRSNPPEKYHSLCAKYLKNKHIIVCDVYRQILIEVRGLISNLKSLRDDYYVLYQKRSSIMLNNVYKYDI